MERRNGHYSEQTGHVERGIFARAMMLLVRLEPNGPISKEAAHMVKRSMRRMPQDGRK